MSQVSMWNKNKVWIECDLCDSPNWIDGNFETYEDAEKAAKKLGDKLGYKRMGKYYLCKDCQSSYLEKCFKLIDELIKKIDEENIAMCTLEEFQSFMGIGYKTVARKIVKDLLRVIKKLEYEIRLKDYPDEEWINFSICGGKAGIVEDNIFLQFTHEYINYRKMFESMGE